MVELKQVEHSGLRRHADLSLSSTRKVDLLQFGSRPTKLKILNRLIPICRGTPVKLIKYRKIYNTRRQLHGSDFEFACMGRTASILRLRFKAPLLPARFIQIFHIRPEDILPTLSFYQQVISNTLIYVASRLNRQIHGKSLNVNTIGTNRSNWGAKFNLHQHRILHVLHRR